jgi:TetR/AcrR family transcriptional regulator
MSENYWYGCKPMAIKKRAKPRSDSKLNASAEHLIQTTAELLSKRSDLNVSFVEIAKHSGLNSALIKYYFKNKEGLLLALLDRDAGKHMEGLAHLVEMNLTAQQKLSLHISAIFQAYFSSPYLNRLIHFMVEHAEPALGARVTQIFVKPLHAAYKSIIEQGVREGAFRRVDPSLLYFSLNGACDHIFVTSQAVEALTGHKQVNEKLMSAHVEHVTNIFLGGIAAPGVSPVTGGGREVESCPRTHRGASMVKLMFCLRRLPTLSTEQFQDYWLNKHAPLVRTVAPLLRIRRYVQSHSFLDARLAPGIAARSGSVPPYDGVAELWWDSIEDVIAAGFTSESRAAGRKLLEDERRFIDLGQSPLYFVREKEIIGAGTPA